MHKLNLGKPQIYTPKFSQHRKTRLPSSSAPPHGHLTINQTFVHLVAPSFRLPNLGAPQSRHTRAPPTKAHLRPQTNTPTSLCAHLHDGRALTQVAKTPTASRHTNRAPHVHRARLTRPPGASSPTPLSNTKCNVLSCD